MLINGNIDNTQASFSAVTGRKHRWWRRWWWDGEMLKLSKEWGWSRRIVLLENNDLAFVNGLVNAGSDGRRADAFVIWWREIW